MYYEMAGEGRTLCLVHGNAMDVRVWDEQFNFFSQYYQVLRYDLRGCGKSQEPTGRYSYDRDLKALLTYLNIEKTAVLGISVGGGIALNFALNYPAMVCALIPVDPFMTGYSWPRTRPLLKELAAHVENGNAQAARRIWNDMPWFDNIRKLPSVYRRFSTIVNENSGWLFEKGNRVDWGDIPMSKRLDEISIPTLVVIGEHDTVDNHQVAQILVSRIRDCRQLIVPDSGHMTMMENPDFFNEHVLKFMQAIDADTLE
jgi:2-succinyl-6-hydroxy-2,4-cyclohexadiene-1-carboxylate synthase